MADISADTLLPSGSFNPSFFSGVLTVPAATPAGAIITLTPPAGKRVRLTAMVSAATDSNITVNNGLSNVVSGLTLSAASTTTSGHFYIHSAGATGAGQGSGSLAYVESYSSITVTKTGGATTNIVYYSYAYGD